MKDLEILRLLLQATKHGTLEWNKTDFDQYSASNIEAPISIHFLYPLLADDATSEPDIVKVTVGRITSTLYNGTEGMSLVRQILAAGLPEWNIHMQNVEEATKEAIEIIRNLMP